MQKGKLNLVMDGAWGSVGKGKFAGYMALKDRPDFAICNFMTNAGHWFRSKKIGDFLVQQLPISAVSDSVLHLYISAGSAITLDVLFHEIDQFEKAGISIRDRLRIDRHAVIIEERHVEMEKAASGTKHIASTMKGCGYALAEKVQRKKTVTLAKDVLELAPFICVVADQVQHDLRSGYTGIGELAQGFDLSLNHGHLYPHVTSRDISPAAFLSDCGVPLSYLGDVYGCLRTYPIRVGNVVENGETTGRSGGFYDDQQELSWEQISERAGKRIEPELTTVTKRIRRVFEFSNKQAKKFVRYCEPTQLVMNFCNYFPNIDGYTRTLDSERHAGFIKFIDHIVYTTGVTVTMFGTGADNDEIIDMRKETKWA